MNFLMNQAGPFSRRTGWMKNNMLPPVFILLWLLMLNATSAAAQQTSIYTNPDADYRKGIELLQQEKYAAAQEQFRTAIDRMHDEAPAVNHERMINARYYDAFCSQQLNRPDAEHLYTTLVNDYESNPTTRRAYFQLGNIYFDQKKYSKCISYYKKTDPADLNRQEENEYNFHMGVSYFFQRNFDKAGKYFAALRYSQNDYYYPSNYYYGYIAYKKGNFKEATSAFNVAGQSELYKPIIPYYLANIDFMQGNYDRVIADAGSLTNASSPYLLEMQQLVGKAYFEKQQYDKALPYFNAYFSGSKKISKADLYQVGFCQYKAGQYDEAIASLTQLNVSLDTIGQNALYILGDCYLKTQRKNDARLAFGSAAKIDADAFVQQQSAFQFAKLSHELNYHDVAVDALQQYIATYPHSSETEDARNYLTLEFLSTNNYRDALAVIRTLKNKNTEMRRAYQKVAFARATEVFNDRNYRGADSLFDESLKNPVDESLQAAAYFWKGECQYRLGAYDAAIDDHDHFQRLLKPKSNLPPNVSETASDYTLGYCYLKNQTYDKAAGYFDAVKKQLKNSHDEAMEKIYTDALLRSGDCQFMLHNYSAATANYDLALNGASNGTDYALYQKAMILGLKEKRTEQIALLQKLTTQFPKSIYADDAMYQLGLALLTVPSYQDAAQVFNSLLDKYPSGSYVVKSHLKLGLIYFNLDNEPAALNQYQWVLTRYPKSEEGAEALSGVKEIYTDKGDVQGYLDFVKGLPNVNVSDAVKDSVSYFAAENKYSKGDCADAVKELSKYLSNFPHGAFATSAHFYRGECLFRQNDFEVALSDYEYVAGQPQSRFSEKALLNAARINYVQKKDYAKAYTYYQQLSANAEFKADALEAAKGMMYSAFYLNKPDNAASAANSVLALPNASSDDQTEAHFYLAKVAYASGNLTKAFNEFQLVYNATSSVIGAESGYRMAEIYFKNNQLKQAETQLFAVAKKSSSHNYWVAKSYLLIARVYETEGDYFQSKATLQSILDNYKAVDDIIPEANQLMDEVKQQEAGASKLQDDTSPADSTGNEN